MHLYKLIKKTFLYYGLILQISCVSMGQKDQSEQAPEDFTVVFATSKGLLHLDIKRHYAPIGVDRFYNLVRNGFYNNQAIFRVVPDWVVQFGISSDPDQSRIWYQANIVDETNPLRLRNNRGTMAFAKLKEKNSRTTQLFINLKDNTKDLDKRGFRPFAILRQPGFAVLQSLYSGYGDLQHKGGRAPNQEQLSREGKDYLKNFPKLDYIRKAYIEPAK